VAPGQDVGFDIKAEYEEALKLFDQKSWGGRYQSIFDFND